MPPSTLHTGTHTLLAREVAACDHDPGGPQMSALDAGVKSLDAGVSSQCSAAVDNLAGFYFKATHPERPLEQPSPAAQVPAPSWGPQISAVLPPSAHALRCPPKVSGTHAARKRQGTELLRTGSD